MYCSPSDKEKSCDRAHDEYRRGRFFQNPTISAWQLFGIPRRESGRPFGWTCCPFCGGDLPMPLALLPRNTEDNYR